MARDADQDRFRPIESDADWVSQGWAAESEPLTVAPRLAATISIRLDPGDAALVRRAARMSGITKSEFVRRSTVRAAGEVVQQGGIIIAEITSLLDRSLTSSGAQATLDHGRPPATTGSNARVLAARR